jgi:hypothetical protein
MKWMRNKPLDDINESITRLTQKLEELEKTIISKQQDIHIETVNIYRPVLEKLSFSLDKVDIKELSGSLNLGNNFGVEMGKEASKKEGKKKGNDRKEKSDGPDPFEVRNTPSGFSVRY